VLLWCLAGVCAAFLVAYGVVAFWVGNWNVW
jgi:hypothetical protein